MRFVLFATSASLLVALATFACTTTEQATTPDPDASAPPPRQEEEEDDDPPSNQPDDEPVNTPPPADGGTDSGGDPVAADVGDGSAGIQCQPGDVRESANNHTEATADLLAAGVPSSYCGRLGAGETDYVKFTLNTAGFGGKYSWSSSAPTITATVDGETFNLSGNGYLFKPQKVYVLKITAAAPTDYRLQLTLQ